MYRKAILGDAMRQIKMAKKQQNIEVCIRNAKEFLNQGDAKSALEELEGFARNDSRRVHFERPDFYRLLWASQEALGIDSHHAIKNGETLSPLTKLGRKIARIIKAVPGMLNGGETDTKGMTWTTALDAGSRLLKEGKARESIVYFKFSIQDNPGECGTSSAIDRARDGIRAAEALIARMESTDAALARKKK